MNAAEGLALQLFENLLLPFSSGCLFQCSTCSRYLIFLSLFNLWLQLPMLHTGFAITSKRRS
jgi:hypothetical protein